MLPFEGAPGLINDSGAAERWRARGSRMWCDSMQWRGGEPPMPANVAADADSLETEFDWGAD